MWRLIAALGAACVGGPAVLLAAFIALMPSYKRSLTDARSAWWMRSTVGHKFLHMAFRIMSRTRAANDKAQGAEGLAKAKALVGDPPPAGAIAFIGSSTFTYWRFLARDIAQAGVKRAVFNAAFGGSCTRHLLPLAGPLCLDWKPAAVVYFCGTNDLNTGLPPQVPCTPSARGCLAHGHAAGMYF
eukprot:gene4548-4773_t